MKSGDDSRREPDNIELSSAQFDALGAGSLYVNVHGAAHPNGEIRARLTRQVRDYFASASRIRASAVP